MEGGGVGSFCAGAMRLWRGVAFCGAVGSFCTFRFGGVSWRALAGVAQRRRDAEAQRGTRLAIELLARTLGLRIEGRWCAFGTTFAHQRWKRWVFGRRLR